MSPRTEKKHSIFIPTDCDESVMGGFFEELSTLIKAGHPEVCIDCSLLEHTSSSHIKTLWDALTRCEHAGVQMKLSAVGYGLERVLKVLDLYDLFTIDDEAREGAPPDRPVSLGVTHMEALKIEFEPVMEGVADALLRFHDFLKKLSVTEVCAFDLETVFYEVATNICRHGGLEAERTVSFSACLRGQYLSLRFTDSGHPFDPTGSTPKFNPREAIKTKQRHGIGLTLIRRLVDSISYECVNNELNVVTLRKKLRLRRR